MRLYPSRRWLLHRQAADSQAVYWGHRARPVRSTWCEQSIRLPGALSVSPRFTFSGREYLREIIDAVDDPQTTEVVFLAGTQTGKSETIRAIVTSQGDVDRAPLMLAGPDQVYAREQRDYIYSVCEASPTLADRVPELHARNDRGIDLAGAYCYLAWSGSTQRLSGRSCKIVLCSEADRWRSSLNLARQRTKAFWRSCVMFEGTPVGSSPALCDLYDASDKRTFRVPCPLCGEYQELRFFPHRDGPHAGRGGVAGLTDDSGNYLSPKAARDAARYCCVNGCLIESHHKGDMIRRGAWCPEGCDVVDGQVVGTPSHDTRRRGYRLNSLYSPTISFGDAAEEWLTVRDSEDGKQSFFNDWLALRYSAHGRQAKWSTLGARLQSSHPRGTVPAQAVFLTCGCDVQDSESYWIVRAWGDGGSSWLVDWGQCPAQLDPTGAIVAGSQLPPLVDVFSRVFPVVGGRSVLGESRMLIAAGGVDIGFHRRMVADFVRGLRDPRIRCVQGMPSPGEMPYRHMRPDDGPAYTGVNTGLYKADIHDRWSIPQGKPGTWLLPHLPDLAVAERYLRQICNEVRQQVINPKTKHISELWAVVDHALRSDYLDCEVYAATLADIVVARDWTGLVDRMRAHEAFFEDQANRESTGFVGRRTGQGGWIR